ncbi:ArsC/Spx/MgsR family protein [Pseudomonas oryzae]|uniref:Nitrogenase-associated protein n=1 Tax=Pseudomonas oryzae TaxID=1392877 RepID=A0A1H1UJ88_9PSED|nr:ArsC/Spx/MgsR family protein [Pseudomonas oryzae]SDS71889.1 nitrogenase-associated protein [Pseudomonas oryzae]
MTRIVFYAKPGCATNARQQRLLRAAGIDLEVRDLLGEPWNAERLLAFFADRPVSEWFNRAAPAVKAGAVVPEALDRVQALALLLATPLLIRRPLLQLGTKHLAGFDPLALNALLPEQHRLREQPAADSDSCAREVHGHSACRAAEEA